MEMKEPRAGGIETECASDISLVLEKGGAGQASALCVLDVPLQGFVNVRHAETFAVEGDRTTGAVGFNLMTRSDTIPTIV